MIDMSQTQIETQTQPAAPHLAIEEDTRPIAPVRTETSRLTRPEVVGPDVPEPPFPIVLSGAVQRGFGRGGKDLGCPTGKHTSLSLPFPRSHHAKCIWSVRVANLPDESMLPMSSVTRTGVYYGYAQVSCDNCGTVELEAEDTQVFPMVMSLGWNPFYKNERMTAVRLHRLFIPKVRQADGEMVGDPYHA